MTKDEALKLALEALKKIDEAMPFPVAKLAQSAIKEALAQPKQKYRRGNRLICLETEEFCVIHISGTDRQWVKFPDSHIGVYTNEQVAELFELLPKEPEQEPVAWRAPNWGHGDDEWVYRDFDDPVLIADGKPSPNNEPLYTTPPPCPTCEALARTVMMDQTGKDV
jgi:hypothetical protein